MFWKPNEHKSFKEKSHQPGQMVLMGRLRREKKLLAELNKAEDTGYADMEFQRSSWDDNWSRRKTVGDRRGPVFQGISL